MPNLKLQQTAMIEEKLLIISALPRVTLVSLLRHGYATSAGRLTIGGSKRPTPMSMLAKTDKEN